MRAEARLSGAAVRAEKQQGLPAQSATVGPPLTLAASGRGTGSSPALMRAMMSAALWRAWWAWSTSCRPTVIRFGPSGPRAWAM